MLLVEVRKIFKILMIQLKFVRELCQFTNEHYKEKTIRFWTLILRAVMSADAVNNAFLYYNRGAPWGNWGNAPKKIPTVVKYKN